jgi:hypothetical protein
MESPKQVRDYDKDPIVIEDYNPFFMALLAFSVVPVMIYVYIYNPGGTSEESLFRNMIIIIPIMMYPYFMGYFKAKRKRRIILSNQTIQSLHEDIVLENIELYKITDIRKTYSDLYHKSQYASEFGKLMSYLIFPIVFLGHLILILNKFLFHIYKNGVKSYRFFDAIIIFEKEKFINILPSTSAEYMEVQRYFKEKCNLDIQNIKAYFEIGHLHEKIDFIK